VIDDKLIDEALKVSKIKTKREVIQKALEEFVKNRKKLDLKQLKGKIEFAEDYDHKKMRT
jgi:Arc/MetJ family transcription regulator